MSGKKLLHIVFASSHLKETSPVNLLCKVLVDIPSREAITDFLTPRLAISADKFGYATFIPSPPKTSFYCCFWLEYKHLFGVCQAVSYKKFHLFEVFFLTKSVYMLQWPRKEAIK